MALRPLSRAPTVARGDGRGKGAGQGAMRWQSQASDNGYL